MALLAPCAVPADFGAAKSAQGGAAASPWTRRARARACCGRGMRCVLAYLPSGGSGLRSQAGNAVATANRAFATLHSDLQAQLSDPDLLKQQAYVGGRWIDSQSGQTIEVGRPPPPPPPLYCSTAQPKPSAANLVLSALLIRCWTLPPASLLRGCPTAGGPRRGRPLPPLKFSSRSGGGGRARSVPPSCAGVGWVAVGRRCYLDVGGSL